MSTLDCSAAGVSRARRQLITAAAAAPLAALAPQAWAQSDFPNRPLRVIVPQPPGGGFDFVARTLAEPLGKALGQGVAVENRTGSGTLVGTEAAAKAPADGYTLLTGSVSNMVLNMGLYKKLPYDALRDFEPVGLAVSYSYTLLGRNGLPFNDLAGLLAYAKANPGKLSYASAGNGSGQHVIAAALWKQAGVELVHIPYRGAQPAYTDLLGERVDLFFDLTPTTRARGHRQAQGPGHVRQGAQPLAAPGADHPRSGRAAGARILVRLLRAEQDAARGAGEAARRIGENHRFARGHGNLPQSGRRTHEHQRGRHARHAGTRRATLDGPHPRREHQPRLDPQ